MIREIRKYMIVVLLALLAADLYGLLVHLLPFRWLEDPSYSMAVFYYGITAWNLLIRFAIAVIVQRDMLAAHEKVSYPILILILFNEYAGLGFFLLFRFFHRYTSTNQFPYAEKN